ncbi:DUF1254 domain-containing protein [Rhizobium sp. NRK18]|uniref:DUF1254 domain-containing protein n=1 Tax=Rhizobium sp. NRK18 TaxID=2964667 RepID=UPI0021C3B7A9|nr:DUF1254 domain-containing protein [Rhizobium sp. NRK18]MCQ2004906.1 DUF1254 domain-containing protein [Rhizobium sp. NRK18]
MPDFRGVPFAVIIGLVGAAILHLITILWLPEFTGRDAFTRVIAEGDFYQFHPLSDQPDAAGLANGDPFLSEAVCGFDAADGPVRLQAVGDLPFWSLAVYDSDSNEVFSINDRTSSGGVMDVVLATPVDLASIRKELPEDFAKSILVEMPVSDGYAVLRAMAPMPSYGPLVRAFLQEARCTVTRPA